MALLYEKVVHTVSKDPSLRTNAEIEQILPWFRKKSELFKSQKAEIVKDILKNCKFMTCNRDYVIIKQGEVGDCFYTILNGCVSIHIQTTLGEDGIVFDQDAGSDEDSDSVKSSPKQAKELDRTIFGNFVGKIPSGRSFGELALINADCVRNASIIADETTDLIVISRDLYNRSLKAFQEKEFNEKKRFVEEYPLFRGWQLRYKRQMAMSLRKEKINFDGILIKQGIPLDGICFLLSGQAKMLADPGMHEIQYPEKFPLPDIAELEKVEARESIRREMNMAVPKEEKRSIYYRSRSPNLADRKRSHKNVEVCVIGAIEIIGDLEMTFNLNSYAQTTQCTEAAEMFVLDQKNYERLIEKRNPHSLDMMRDSLHEKLKLRMSWMNDEDLPLFRYFLYKLDERQRQEVNRIREYNRKRDMRETIDYWRSGKLFNGPLIDQYGPGSVFYTIRMRAKSKRNQLRAKAGAQGFGITRSLALMNKASTGAFMARKVDFRGSNQSVNGHMGNANGNAGMVRNGQRYYSDSDENSDLEESEIEEVDGQIVPKNSKVFCDNARINKHGKGGNGRVDLPQKPRTSVSVDDFMKHEMNELSLARLELRIQEWHNRVNKLEKPSETKMSRLDKKRLVKLHRYNAEDSKKPLPGKKIIIKPRVRPKPTMLTLRLEDMENPSTSSHSPPATADDPSPTLHRDVEARDAWNEETDSPCRHSVKRRPLSSKPSFCTSPIQIQRRPKSARNYTAEEYVHLKEELRRKQIAYKSMLISTGSIFV